MLRWALRCTTSQHQSLQAQLGQVRERALSAPHVHPCTPRAPDIAPHVHSVCTPWVPMCISCDPSAQVHEQCEHRVMAATEAALARRIHLPVKCV